MADNYVWIGGSGTFGGPGQWNDFTTGQTPAPQPPGSGDDATINNGTGTIGGTGTVRSLDVSATYDFTGTVTAGSVQFNTSASITKGTVTGTTQVFVNAGTMKVSSGGTIAADLASGAILDAGTLVLASGGQAKAFAIDVLRTMSVTTGTLSAASLLDVSARTKSNASLTLGAGAVATAKAMTIGDFGGGTATANVFAGGTLTVAENLLIGAGSQGTLLVGTGSSVSIQGGGSTTALIVGALSNGLIDVQGSLGVTGDVNLGLSGSCTLNVQSGAGMNVSGTFEAGTASIEVDGSLTLGNAFSMDTQAGTLSIGSGGAVAGPGDGHAVTLHGSLVVNGGSIGGHTLSAFGTVSLQSGTIAFNSVLLGSNTTSVENASVGSGGLLNAGVLEIAPLMDDREILRVQTGGTLQSSIQMMVGGQGRAALEVSDGGLAMVNGGLTEGSPALDLGALNAVSSGTIGVVSGGSLFVTGAANLGDAGAGIVLVGGGGKFSISQGLYEGVQASGSGTLRITDASDTFSVGGDWVIGDAGSHSDTLSGGASASVGGALTIARGTGSGTLTVSGAGSAAGIVDDVTVGGLGAGTLEIDTGGKVSAANATIGAAGMLSLADGTLAVGGSAAVAGVVSGFGTISGALSVSGTVTASGGALVLTGLVNGAGTLGVSGGTLELQSGVQGGEALAFSGAGTAVFDLASPAAVVVHGFGTGDSLVLKGVVANFGTFAAGALALDNGGVTTGSVAFAGAYTSDNFTVVSAGNQTTITYVACFAAGTRIATASGATAVEYLRPGMRALSAFGGAAEVVWIGHRRIDCRTHPRPWDVCPVRVRAGAFGAGRPSVDLWLSPDHAVFVEGVLMPVRYLVNGATIVQEAAEWVTYYHVELPAHDVILAEGLPCESYLDTGNRAAFANGGVSAMLHADFARGVWEGEACAPLVVEGGHLASVRRMLFERAEVLGYRLTDDAAVVVLADGRAVEMDGGLAHLPPETREVRLLSRSFVPAWRGDPDTRRLGIAVAGVWLDGVKLKLDGPGWRTAEAGWQWSDGAGVIEVAGGRVLRIERLLHGTYWEEPRRDASARPSLISAQAEAPGMRRYQ